MNWETSVSGGLQPLTLTPPVPTGWSSQQPELHVSPPQDVTTEFPAPTPLRKFDWARRALVATNENMHHRGKAAELAHNFEVSARSSSSVAGERAG